MGAADVAADPGSVQNRWDQKFKEWESAYDKLNFLDPLEPEYDKQLARIDHLDAQLDALMEASEIEDDLDAAEFEHESEGVTSLLEYADPEDREEYRRRLQALADDAELQKRELNEQIAQMRKSVPYGTVVGAVPEGARKSRFPCARCSAALFQDSNRTAMEGLEVVHPCGNCGYDNETEIRARADAEREANTMPDLDAIAAWAIASGPSSKSDAYDQYGELRLLRNGTLWEGPETGQRLKSNFASRCDPGQYTRFTTRKFKAPHKVDRFLNNEHDDLGSFRLVPPTTPIASWTYTYTSEYKRKTTRHEERICLYPDGGIFLIDPTNSGKCVNEGEVPLATAEEAERYILDLIRRSEPGFAHHFVDLVRNTEVLNPAALPEWKPKQDLAPSSSTDTAPTPSSGQPLAPASEEQKFVVRQELKDRDASAGKLDDNVAFVLQLVLVIAIFIFYAVAPITVILPLGALLYLVIHQAK